jgi:uncharacterized protein YdhG (YjbR/CyaY superfamily)
MARARQATMAQVAAQAERTIRRTAPRLRRVVKYGAPTYQWRGDVCTVGTWTRFVAVGFWSGARLAPRHAMLEGSAKGTRVAKLRTVEEARSAAFAALVRDAARLDAEEPEHARPAAPSREVAAYLAKLPQPQRAALRRLRAAIRSAAPEAEEGIRYGIPSYTLHGYLVGFAAFKKHCSFFPGAASVAKHRAALRGYATAKGTIRFAPEQPLPEALVRRIVKDRVAESRASQGRARPGTRH